MFKKLLVASTALAMTGGIALAQDQAPELTDGDRTDVINAPTVLNADNAMIEDGRLVGVSVSTPDGGYVVVHDDGAGAVPANIGVQPVAPGETDNLSIALTAAPTGNVIVMLHNETNGNDTYDFGPGSTDVDTPAVSGDQPVTAPVTTAQ